MLFADDDTDNTNDKNPQELEAKIQREADRSTDWVEDNKMACAGDKTKLLIIGTRQLRASKLVEPNELLKVKVCGIDIESTESEKLLGLTISNDLSWKAYLYGETWRIPEKDNLPGLLPQLSQRVGMLRKLSNLVPKPRFKMLCQGIFDSKVLYCLQVFGNVWGFGYDETERRYSGFTREDSRKLQVIQNKVCRMKTGLGYEVSSKSLLQADDDLSIHQLIAYHTLVTVHKIKGSQKPRYIDERLPFRPSNDDDDEEPHRNSKKIYVGNQELNMSRAGFVYRGGHLWNQLPTTMRTLSTTVQFKQQVRGWVKQNVTIKPG